MGESRVEVVRVGHITPLANADSLELTHVFDYPVIFRNGDFMTGDLAIYVPVDSIVPTDDPRWEFLGEHRRIKARRLRGTYSMGLLVPADKDMSEGDDVTGRLGIMRYVTPEELTTGGEDEYCPVHIPYYDIEGLRRWPDVLHSGEDVVITEKLHGANGSFIWHNDRLYCKSHTRFKRESEMSIWWKAARSVGLGDKLVNAPDIAFYGEVYGQVQDLKYGVNSGVRLALFDAFDRRSGHWIDHDEFIILVKRLGLPHVPVLYHGPWDSAIPVAFAEGQSTLGPCVREGIVVKPVHERFDDRIGRVILKLHGEGFNLRKQRSKT